MTSLITSMNLYKSFLDTVFLKSKPGPNTLSAFTKAVFSGKITCYLKCVFHIIFLATVFIMSSQQVSIKNTIGL